MIKSTKQIEWEQDTQYLRLKIELVGVTSIQNVELYLSDLVLRINITSKKIVKVFDFQNEVDYLSKDNKFVFIGSRLECTIVKKHKTNIWNSLLIQNITKQDLIERRKQSFKRREEYYEKYIEQIKKIKIQQDSYSTREQMRLDDEQRTQLESMKEKEKQEAMNYIYEDIQEYQDSDQEYQQSQSTIDKTIFDQNQVESVRRELPAIRDQQKVDVQFTEKVFGNLAAREQYLEEAPLPKLKKMAQNEKNKINMNEIKNPIWLKEKGDELYRNKDYLSSINAYQNAFKLDNKLINNISNIGLCHLQLFNFNECIQFCQKVLDFIDGLENEERIKYLELKIKNEVRKAMCLSWRGELNEALEQLQQTSTLKIKDEKVKEQMDQIEQKIQKRLQQKELKDKGNYEFQNGNLDKAMIHYNNGLEVDQSNETILSNVSLILMQKDKYEESLEYCQRGIDQIYSLVSQQNLIQEQNNNYNRQYDTSQTIEILVKQLYRKAKLLFRMSKLEDSLYTCREIISLDLNNKETRTLQNQVNKQIKKCKYEQLREQGKEQIQQDRIVEALEILKESQQLLDKEDVEEYLKVMLNKCVCYMKINKWEDIISTSIQGLSIITNHKNRVIAFKQKQLGVKIEQFQKIFLIRRGNSYLQLKQYYNAKQDLENAYKLAPEDQKLKTDIENLKRLMKQ